MRVNTNIAALNAWRNLTANQSNLAKSLEKLSSGYRINKAADDAAGLAVSEKMRSQIRGVGMAVRNTQDAVSLMQTAEGGASKVQDMLQRMRELSVQASSDTLQDSDRSKLNEEFTNLVAEITRTTDTVTFNGRKLIDGSAGDKIAVSNGAANLKSFSASSLNTSISGVKSYTVAWGTLAAAQVQGSAGATSATGTGGNAVWTGGASSVLDSAVFAGDLTGTEKVTFSQAGKSISINFSDTDTNAVTGGTGNTAVKDLKASEFIDYVNAKAGANGMDMRLSWDSTRKIQISANTAGTASAVAVAESGFVAATSFGFAATTNASDASVTSITDNTSGGTVAATNYSVVGNKLVGKSGSAIQGVTLEFGTASQSATIDLSRNDMTFQVGANSGETISAAIGNLTATSLNINSLAIGSKSGAQNALSAIDTALSNVTSERSKMGAIQNRLENTISILQVQNENVTAAESRIRDVDMAQEMANFTKFQILSQAGTSMLAQANQSSQGILSLLR